MLLWCSERRYGRGKGLAHWILCGHFDMLAGDVVVTVVWNLGGGVSIPCIFCAVSAKCSTGRSFGRRWKSGEERILIALNPGRPRCCDIPGTTATRSACHATTTTVVAAHITPKESYSVTHQTTHVPSSSYVNLPCVHHRDNERRTNSADHKSAEMSLLRPPPCPYTTPKHYVSCGEQRSTKSAFSTDSVAI